MALHLASLQNLCDSPVTTGIGQATSAKLTDQPAFIAHFRPKCATAKKPIVGGNALGLKAYSAKPRGEIYRPKKTPSYGVEICRVFIVFDSVA
jgi:hypothetical protein